MRLVFEKDFDSAREVLRKALAHGINNSLAEQYAKVLEDFLRRRDGLEEGLLPGSAASAGRRAFGVCEVMTAVDGRGRGLTVPALASWGDQLWRERPLAFIQSPASKRAVQACCACLAPVGSLATQLAYLGLPTPPGTEALSCGTGSSSSSPAFLPCPGEGCSEVFCGEACRDWSLEASSHALLCAGRLPPLCLAALQRLECLAAESDTEHLLLLAHSVAQMLLLRRAGVPLEDVLHRHAHQFVSQPWDQLASSESGASPDDTPESRRELLARAAALLQELFAFTEAELVAPLLEPGLLGGLLGTYELVNMCISIPHPLNSCGDRVCELLTGTDLLARIARLQEDAEVSSDSGAEDEEDGEATTNEEAAQAARSGSLFAYVLGSAHCEALAYTNHSCLPNCNIDFSTAHEEHPWGPGLWVHGTARRPLLPGDEVLMVYVPSVVGKPLEVRQRRMRRFGFTCRCRSCVTDEMLAAEDVPIPAATSPE